MHSATAIISSATTTGSAPAMCSPSTACTRRSGAVAAAVAVVGKAMGAAVAVVAAPDPKVPTTPATQRRS